MRAPQSPQHSQTDTLALLLRIDIEHVDVQPIAQGIDTVIDVANALDTDLDVVQVANTPITSTKAIPAQRVCIEQYKNQRGFEPLHQDELDCGDMTFAQVAQANIDWFEAWASDTHLSIQKNPADLEDDEAA